MEDIERGGSRLLNLLTEDEVEEDSSEFCESNGTMNTTTTSRSNILFENDGVDGSWKRGRSVPTTKTNRCSPAFCRCSRSGFVSRGPVACFWPLCGGHSSWCSCGSGRAPGGPGGEFGLDEDRGSPRPDVDAFPSPRSDEGHGFLDEGDPRSFQASKHAKALEQRLSDLAPTPNSHVRFPAKLAAKIMRLRSAWSSTCCGSSTITGGPVLFHSLGHFDVPGVTAKLDSLRTIYIWWVESGLDLQVGGRGR